MNSDQILLIIATAIIGGIVGLSARIFFDWIKGNKNSNGNGSNGNGTSKLFAEVSNRLMEIAKVVNDSADSIDGIRTKQLEMETGAKYAGEESKYLRTLLTEQKDLSVKTITILEGILSALRDK